MTDRFFIHAENQAGLLWAVLEEIGSTGLIALEGDLEGTGVMGLPASSPNETQFLRRQTIEPMLDFVVLPTKKEIIADLKQRLSGTEMFGGSGRLVHVQIEKDGDRVFIACDNFHRDCTWLQIPRSDELLKKLRANGIVRSYSTA